MYWKNCSCVIWAWTWLLMYFNLLRWASRQCTISNGSFPSSFSRRHLNNPQIFNNKHDSGFLLAIVTSDIINVTSVSNFATYRLVYKNFHVFRQNHINTDYYLGILLCVQTKIVLNNFYASFLETQWTATSSWRCLEESNSCPDLSKSGQARKGWLLQRRCRRGDYRCAKRPWRMHDTARPRVRY